MGTVVVPGAGAVHFGASHFLRGVVWCKVLQTAARALLGSAGFEGTLVCALAMCWVRLSVPPGSGK